MLRLALGQELATDREEGRDVGEPADADHRARIRGVARTLGHVQGDVTLYEAVGGMPFFEELVDRFYEGVSKDPELLRLYPEPEDLSEARRKLALFLAQYWGGPANLLPGARAPGAADAPRAVRDRNGRAGSLAHATCSRPSTPWSLRPDVAQALRDYLEMAADALRNVDH